MNEKDATFNSLKPGDQFIYPNNGTCLKIIGTTVGMDVLFNAVHMDEGRLFYVNPMEVVKKVET